MSTCRVGFARADLTPERSGPTCGWGPMGRKDAAPPADVAQRILTSVLALEDAAGERIVLVNADLHCGSWPLWQAAVEASGLDAGRVIVCGTHTHAGPHHRYGSLGYTLFAGPSPHRARGMTRFLVPRLAEAVRQAITGMVPGGVALTREVVLGAASNRAMAAWDNNDEETRAEFTEQGPGSLIPADGPVTDRLRDPRVTVLTARSDDGSVRAALAWFAVHGTSLGADYPFLGADLFGWARDEAERDGWSIGYGGGSSGDISPIPTDEAGEARSDPDRRSEQGEELGKVVGRRLGRATSKAIAQAEPEPFSLAAAHEIWRPRSSGLPWPMVGLAQAGGGLDGPSDLRPELGDGVHAPLYRKRRRLAYSTASGQAPKVGIAQVAVPLPIRARLLFLAGMPRRFPLHVVRVGDHAFATFPGEPTTMSGWRAERAVLDATGCASASIIGFAGDYGGYWVTPEEYREQRYEGAATIYGAESATRLTERLGELAARVATPG